MDAASILTKIRDHREDIAERCKAPVVGIFGSYARDEQRKESDLDVLYEPLERGYFSLTELNDLDEYLQRLTLAPSKDRALIQIYHNIGYPITKKHAFLDLPYYRHIQYLKEDHE